jgi:hypothetical protein
MITSDKFNRILIESGASPIPTRQGPFTKEECESAWNQMEKYQRDESHCECEGTNNSGLYETQGKTESRIQIEDHQTQLKKLKEAAYKKEMEKKNSDRQIVEDIKQDLRGKLKAIKSLDQLKTVSNLSLKGEQNVNNNQTEAGRDDSESAFSEGKIDPNNSSLPDNNIVVPPPAFIEQQKTLFEYLDQQKKVVQTKITDVNKEKTKIDEKKKQLQEKITGQTISIKRLTVEKTKVEEETKKVEIDSLLLLAEQMLDESIEQNKKADKDLEKVNNQLQENEALLNRYDETYNKSKEHPEESEQLLKELSGDK